MPVGGGVACMVLMDGAEGLLCVVAVAAAGGAGGRGGHEGRGGDGCCLHAACRVWGMSMRMVGRGAGGEPDREAVPAAHSGWNVKGKTRPLGAGSGTPRPGPPPSPPPSDLAGSLESQGAHTARTHGSPPTTRERERVAAVALSPGECYAPAQAPNDGASTRPPGESVCSPHQGVGSEDAPNRHSASRLSQPAARAPAFPP